MARFDNVGEVIRTLREERQWNQGQLARRAKISIAMVSKYERGVRKPSLRTLGYLLDALDVRLGPLDHRLDLVNDRHHPSAPGVAPTEPDGVDLERFLGYSRLPPELLPAFSEMVAGFQRIARLVASRVLAERRSG